MLEEALHRIEQAKAHGAKRLDLGGFDLAALPLELGELTGLAVLDISECGLIALPDWLRDFKNLQGLYLSSNGLVEIPEWIGNFEKLVEFAAENNRLQTLPASFAKLTKLEVLYLDGNRLTELPKGIIGLTSLKTLLVNSNYITALPHDIDRLRHLERLYIERNQLTAIPEAVSNLPELFSLHLGDNDISYLPNSLADLPRFTQLGVSGNPLISPPPEIVAGGSESILSFLRARRQGVIAQWASKLLVVGEGGVGKTSLIKALTRRTYDPDEPSTHGIRIEHLDLEHLDQADTTMRLKTWDFGGQEIYHATHQFFLTNRSLFLLVWNSRHGWEQGRLRYWLDIISARAPESPVVLVVTHCEDRPVDFPLDDLRREYPRIVASISVDNRTHAGIDALRDLLAAEAARLPLMGAEWPRRWVRAVSALFLSSENQITPDRMWELMATAGVRDPAQQRYLAVALHELGDILYYGEDPELCDTVVLQPEWVNGYISKVLDSPEVEASHGLLTRKHLKELWRGLDRGTSDHFLSMMDKYDLSYRVDGRPDDVSLVVERLSWNPPPYQDQWDAAAGTSEIRVVYKLNTMPPGIPTWFIARSHRFSTNTHWRTGALLQRGEELALVRADAHRKTVELTVRGPSPAAFFSILDDGLNRTLERYPGLAIDRQVPCPCEPDCTEFYNYDILSNRLTRKPPRYQIECHRSGELVDIPGLLLGLAPSERDMTDKSIKQIAKTLTRLEENAEYNQRMFMRLLHIAQVQQETRCPSVFALVQVKKNRYELRLYCEEPGAWHRLPEPAGCYPIKQPAKWLRKVGPHLKKVLTVLKFAAPLAGPILGITVDQLSQQLKSDADLMKELLAKAPSELNTEDQTPGYDDIPTARAGTEADFRVIEAMLEELDPEREWGGLSRTTTPEGLTLYLCAEHRKAYLP